MMKALKVMLLTASRFVTHTQYATTFTKTRPQLLLRWLRDVVQIKCLLSSGDYLSFTHSFSVISENIAINLTFPKTIFFAYIFIADSMGLPSTVVT